jgi:hypothetical protein
MKLKPLLLWCSASVLLLGSLGAHAGLVTGTFSGVVLASEDVDYWEDSGDVWNGDITGQTFTGKVWWSTDLPETGFGTPQRGTYGTNSNGWLGLEFFIDGKSIVVSNNDYPGMQQIYTDVYESVVIDNPSDGTTEDEFVHMADGSYYEGSNGEYMRKSSNLGLVNLQVGLQGIGLEQAFSYIAPADDNNSYAYLFLDGRIDNKSTYAMAYMRIDEFHLSTNSSSVSEPSTLVLAGMGLLGLGWRRRQKQQGN